MKKKKEKNVLISKLKGKSLHDSFIVSFMNCVCVLDQSCTRLRSFKRPVVTETTMKCKSFWMQQRLMLFRAHNSGFISFITAMKRD